MKTLSMTPQAVRSRRHRLESPEKYKRSSRRAHLKRRYGIALEVYEKLYLEQDGKCAICLKWQPILDVDHEKPSGEIRGLLCHRCNWAMGIFGDDPEKLQSAVNYLARNAAGWSHK